MSDDPTPEIAPDIILNRGGAVLQALTDAGIDPFTNALDLLVVELLGILILRALGVEGSKLDHEIARLTTTAELINIHPLRQLLEERRALSAGSSDGPVAGVPQP